MNISAESLVKRYSLSDHVENGAFIERHYPDDSGRRPASGSIYYYVSPHELTKFHEIDCDEYWCYIKGSPLEIWVVDTDGNIRRERLGIEEGCEPIVLLRAGMIFGSRHFRDETEGTFLSCITVPRYEDAGFRLYEKEEILEKHPGLMGFFE